MRYQFIASGAMVRRLIQHFLHWPRSVLAQVRGSESSRQPPSPQQKLPPSQSHQEAASDQASSHPVPTPPLPNDQPGTESSILEQPIQTTTSAATGVASDSNFQMLLSDYRYSPNPAIQDLSHQLSQSPSQTEAQSPATSPRQSDPDLLDPENSFPINTGPLPDFLTTQQASSPAEKLATSLTDRLSHISEIKPAETDIVPLRKHTPDGITARQNLPLSPLISPETLDSETWMPPPDLTTAQVSYPEILTAQPYLTSSETTIADSEIITKQGVIKLLFKLKQNNYHGYIEPNDGSKDIIFHQKYIGHEIFRQLERGMEVEVTAHITAGKAYADHVRIL